MGTRRKFTDREQFILKAALESSTALSIGSIELAEDKGKRCIVSKAFIKLEIQALQKKIDYFSMKVPKKKERDDK